MSIITLKNVGFGAAAIAFLAWYHNNLQSTIEAMNVNHNAQIADLNRAINAAGTASSAIVDKVFGIENQIATTLSEHQSAIDSVKAAVMSAEKTIAGDLSSFKEKVVSTFTEHKSDLENVKNTMKSAGSSVASDLVNLKAEVVQQLASHQSDIDSIKSLVGNVEHTIEADL